MKIQATCGQEREWAGLYRRDYDLSTPDSMAHPAIYGIMGIWKRNIKGIFFHAPNVNGPKVLVLKLVLIVPHDNKEGALAISSLVSVNIAEPNLKFPNGVLSKAVAIFVQEIVKISSRLHS